MTFATNSRSNGFPESSCGTCTQPLAVPTLRRALFVRLDEVEVDRVGREMLRGAGEQVVATKAFDTKREAETWERTQKHLLETGRPLPPKRSFTLEELVTMFLAARERGNPHTVDTDRNNLAALPKIAAPSTTRVGPSW